MRKIGVDCVHVDNRALADKIMDYHLDSTTAFALSSSIAEAIHLLWQDPIIPKVMDEHTKEFYLMDSAS